mmetsp:Transcript_17842/g.30453  ORF Transcript_17842/g.30453 Transcript_17842/m.30453 type:complete len:587 (-) Transcript_17842:990-2750(-)
MSDILFPFILKDVEKLVGLAPQVDRGVLFAKNRDNEKKTRFKQRTNPTVQMLDSSKTLSDYVVRVSDGQNWIRAILGSECLQDLKSQRTFLHLSKFKGALLRLETYNYMFDSVTMSLKQRSNLRIESFESPQSPQFMLHVKKMSLISDSLTLIKNPQAMNMTLLVRPLLGPGKKLLFGELRDVVDALSQGVNEVDVWCPSRNDLFGNPAQELEREVISQEDGMISQEDNAWEETFAAAPSMSAATPKRKKPTKKYEELHTQAAFNSDSSSDEESADRDHNSIEATAESESESSDSEDEKSPMKENGIKQSIQVDDLPADSLKVLCTQVSNDSSDDDSDEEEVERPSKKRVKESLPVPGDKKTPGDMKRPDSADTVPTGHNIHLNGIWDGKTWHSKFTMEEGKQRRYAHFSFAPVQLGPADYCAVCSSEGSTKDGRCTTCSAVQTRQNGQRNPPSGMWSGWILSDEDNALKQFHVFQVVFKLVSTQNTPIWEFETEGVNAQGEFKLTGSVEKLESGNYSVIGEQTYEGQASAYTLEQELRRLHHIASTQYDEISRLCNELEQPAPTRIAGLEETDDWVRRYWLNRHG